MEEILHHPGCKKNLINNGINYKYQLVQDFWAINSREWMDLGHAWVMLFVVMLLKHPIRQVGAVGWDPETSWNL